MSQEIKAYKTADGNVFTSERDALLHDITDILFNGVDLHFKDKCAVMDNMLESGPSLCSFIQRLSRLQPPAIQVRRAANADGK